MKQRLYFDIETAPDEEKIKAWLKANPFDEDSVKLGNIKDPAKIKARLKNERQKHESRIREKAALNPALCRILTVQWAVDGGGVMVFGGEEREVIFDFFENVIRRAAKIINWTGNNNSSNFDLNMLTRRAAALGVKVPIDLDELRFDLAAYHLRYADRPTFLSLENAARELRIEVEDSPVTGADFHRWYRGEIGVGSPEDQRAAALHYAKQDVRLLREIDRRVAG